MTHAAFVVKQARLLLLAAAGGLVLAPCGAAANLDVLAVTGEPVNGQAGSPVYDNFWTVQANGAGQVAVQAGVVGGSSVISRIDLDGSAMVLATEGQAVAPNLTLRPLDRVFDNAGVKLLADGRVTFGQRRFSQFSNNLRPDTVFVADPGGVEAVVRDGLVTSLGTLSTRGSLQGYDVNDRGDVAVSIGSGDGNEFIAVRRASDGSWSTVVTTGDAAVGGGTFVMGSAENGGNSNVFFDGLSQQVRIDARGRAVWYGNAEFGFDSFETGLFRSDGSGPIETLARAGDPRSDGPLFPNLGVIRTFTGFDEFGNPFEISAADLPRPTINRSGQALAVPEGGEFGFTVTPEVFRLGDGGDETVLGAFMPSPFGVGSALDATFEAPPEHFNDAGQAVFAVTVLGVPFAERSGLVFWDGQALRPVLRSGDALPGGGAFNGIRNEQMDLSEDGRVLLHLDGDPNVSFNDTIYVWDDGTLERVIGPGDALLGSTVAKATLGVRRFDDATWDITAWAGDGSAVLLAELADGREAVLRWSAGLVVGLAGDFDGSGAVEQADLDLVLTNWGAPRVGFQNDAGFSTANVDQEELDAVLTNWGASSGGASAAPSFAANPNAVPEPAAALGVALLLLAGGQQPRGRGRVAARAGGR